MHRYTMDLLYFVPWNFTEVSICPSSMEFTRWYQNAMSSTLKKGQGNSVCQIQFFRFSDPINFFNQSQSSKLCQLTVTDCHFANSFVSLYCNWFTKHFCEAKQLPVFAGNPPSGQRKKNMKQRFLKLLPCCHVDSNPAVRQSKWPTVWCFPFCAFFLLDWLDIFL